MFSEAWLDRICENCIDGDCKRCKFFWANHYHEEGYSTEEIERMLGEGDDDYEEDCY